MLLAGSGHARAATINVPTDQPTIQDGIAAAVNGDIVQVKSGTYFENINFLGKAITVRSSDGAAVTTINGSASGPVVTFNKSEGNGSVLSGFTITNGLNSSSFTLEGGGVAVVFASPTIVDNVITANYSCGGGGGIGVYFGAPTIESNTITKNGQRGCTGGNGGGGIEIGGIPASGQSQIIGNTIANNSWTSGNGGGISLYSAGTPLVQNNLIYSNRSSGVFTPGGLPTAQGGGIFLANGGQPMIVQNLIYDNTSDLGGGVAIDVPCCTSSTVLVSNTIADNVSTQNLGSALYSSGYAGSVQVTDNLLIAASGANPVYCDPSYDPWPPVFFYNDVYGPGGVSFAGSCTTFANLYGNFSADPAFTNAAAGNYGLAAGSPAIDAGSNLAPGLLLNDFYGDPRIVPGILGDAAIIDPGAAEYQPKGGPFPTPTPTPTAMPTPGNVIKVPGDQPTIQDGIGAAINGDIVQVAPGTYFEVINFQGKAIQVVSTGGPQVTTINGHGAGSVVSFWSGEGRNSVLSGFTITGGLALAGPYYGGGILIQNASPTITGNTIVGNQACNGGAGISISGGSPLIQSDTITSNSQEINEFGFCEGGGGAGINVTGAGSPQIIGNTISGNNWFNGIGGGGIYVSGANPLIKNNLLESNLASFFYATTPSAYGGGIYLEYGSNASIIQNLIIDNTADFGGGIALDNSSAPLLVNNTFSGNSTTQDQGSGLYATTFSAATQLVNNLIIGTSAQPAVSCGSGVPVATGNDFFTSGGAAIDGSCAVLGESGNISDDPLFANTGADDYHLLPGSPAIDAGNNSAPQLPATDYYGKPRNEIGYVGDAPIVDMGIAEVQTAGPRPSPTPTMTPTPTATPTPTMTPTPVPFALEVTPAYLQFGKNQLGELVPSVRGVTVKNPRGARRASIEILSLTAAGDATGSYTIWSGSYCKPGMTLSPGSDCTMQIAFSPLALGASDGNFIVVSNSTTKATSTVRLKGKGVLPELKVSAKILNLSTIPIGSSNTMSVTLSSNVRLPVAISGIALEDNRLGEFGMSQTCGSVLAARGQCEIAITFAPVKRGLRKARLAITAASQPAKITVALKGTGN